MTGFCMQGSKSNFLLCTSLIVLKFTNPGSRILCDLGNKKMPMMVLSLYVSQHANWKLYASLLLVVDYNLLTIPVLCQGIKRDHGHCNVGINSSLL